MMHDDTPSLHAKSPFYRVTAKALIYDNQQRLLVVKSHNGNWELPGGGWEHDESYETCLAREISEELGVDVESVGRVCFMYRGHNIKRGFMTLRIVAPATIASHEFTLGDDIQEAIFVTRDEFLSMDFVANEGEVAEHVDSIWPKSGVTVDKTPVNL